MKSLWIGARIGMAVLSSAAWLGCGGSATPSGFADDAATDSTGTTDGGVDGAVDDTGAPADGAGDTPADTPVDTGPPVTLDNVCGLLADGMCGKAADTCCTKSGLGYDDKACHAAATASCGESVAAVKAGTRKFDGTALELCIAAWNKLETACTVNLIEFIRTYPACQKLFAGTLGPGTACKNDAECAPPPGGVGDCSDPNPPFSGPVCRQYTIVGKDAACNVGGDVQAFCDLGLYCAVSTGSSKGTCKTAKKPSDSCDLAAWWECGYGYTCQAASPFGGGAKCAEGKAAGSFCTRDAECASWSCASGKCTSNNFPIANRALCGGG